MTKSLDAAVVTEVAKDALNPIILLDIQTSTAVYYALHPVDIVFDSQTYIGIGGKLGEITESSSMQIGSLTIEINNVNRTFSAFVCSDAMTEFRGKDITVKRVFGGLLGNAAAFEYIWKGTIDTWDLTGRKFTMTVKDWIASLWKESPRRTCHRNCPWRFGGSYCGLTDSAAPGAGEYKKLTGQVADAGSTDSRLVDSVLTEADDFWQHGFVEFTSGDNSGLPARKISTSNQAGTYVDLEIPWPNTISAGDQYTIWQACDHSPGTCKTVFDNMVNYGGNLSVPRKPYR